MAGLPDAPSDPAVVVLSPDDEIAPQSFAAWLDRCPAGNRLAPGCGLLTPSPKRRWRGVNPVVIDALRDGLQPCRINRY